MPPKRAPPQKLPMEEEDDDEEVEMLSISSEDESFGRRKETGNVGKVKARQEMVEEEEWEEEDEEEEPATWKPGYKAELERRVRELRETRGASATVQFQRARTIVDPAAARGDDFIDPLGLGYVASPTNVFVLEWLTQKLLYTSEKFDPKFFLSHVHQNTAAVDFKGAEQGLKEDLKLRNNELKKLVKENFDCFISCKNTIDDGKLKPLKAPKGKDKEYDETDLANIQKNMEEEKTLKDLKAKAAGEGAFGVVWLKNSGRKK